MSDMSTDDYSTRSGESERINASKIAGVTADNYYWCWECASTTELPEHIEDVPMRGHTLTRCSHCGRRLSEVHA
jgi:hypothetical protein